MLLLCMTKKPVNMIHTFETTEENALRNGKDPTTYLK
jgi:hypothetical protein